jgi:hypothetical protein
MAKMLIVRVWAESRDVDGGGPSGGVFVVPLAQSENAASLARGLNEAYGKHEPDWEELEAKVCEELPPEKRKTRLLNMYMVAKIHHACVTLGYPKLEKKITGIVDEPKDELILGPYGEGKRIDCVEFDEITLPRWD